MNECSLLLCSYPMRYVIYSTMRYVIYVMFCFQSFILYFSLSSIPIVMNIVDKLFDMMSIKSLQMKKVQSLFALQLNFAII